MIHRFPPVQYQRQCRRLRLCWRLLAFAALLTLHASPVPAAEDQQPVTNELGMRFVSVPAGMFIMGSPVAEAYRYLASMYRGEAAVNGNSELL